MGWNSHWKKKAGTEAYQPVTKKLYSLLELGEGTDAMNKMALHVILPVHQWIYLKDFMENYYLEGLCPTWSPDLTSPENVVFFKNARTKQSKKHARI
jgi:hypothetical protein